MHTFFLRRVLTIEDLPTFGYPMRPTEICLRSECKALNCRSREISDPLPKLLLIDAWKASVGNSLDRCLTHAA